MGRHLRTGDRVPEFTLKDQDGKPFTMAGALGQGPVVVYFYPKDFTGGCTAEACEFRDVNGDFEALGARIVGISSDDVSSHRRFADAHQLRFTLLADPGGAVRQQFGVEKSMFGLVDGRVTFVIDREGVIRHRFDGLIQAKRHVKEAIDVVRQLALPPDPARPSGATVRQVEQS